MLGILLAFVTAVLFGISVAIQKHSMGTLGKFTIKGLLSHKVWIVALVVGVVGIVAYMVSMSLAPLTTVQPILAFSMVIPILAGATLFKEKMEVWRWVFVAVLVAGIFLVSLY